MVRELFRNVMFNKDDASIDFNIMRDKENPSYSLLLLRTFNNFYNELLKIYENS